MKRLPFFFTILTLLLLLPIISHGQFVIGAKIGSNYCWIGGQDFLDDLNSWDVQGRGETSAKTGFTGGLYLSVEVSKYLSLQQEALYTNLGGRYSYYTSQYEEEYMVESASVLELPFFIKPKVPLGPGSIYVFAGPEILIFLSDITIEEEEYSFSLDTFETVKTIVKIIEHSPDNSVVFGISGGIGYEYPGMLGTLSFELKYLHTLTEIFENYESNFSAICILIGYGFTL